MGSSALARWLSSRDSRSTLVTFTGGMGAQIISAAIYFAMKLAGEPVYADLSYFDISESIATAGQAGETSHWPWQLSDFGLFPETFDTLGKIDKRCTILNDGATKLDIGLNALSRADVQRVFNVPEGIDDLLDVGGGKDSFLCMHVRRGDYLNVASYLVADEEFLNLSRKFTGLVNSAVVLSDSPIDQHFRTVVASYFEEVHFLDSTDAYQAHRIMRAARILICSNSQFSLTAAALNVGALAIIPRQWFGDDARHLEVPIQGRSRFLIYG
jgi:Glycosyl transferase family 11